MPYKVKDIKKSSEGRINIGMASCEMPGIANIVEEYRNSKPLKGARIAGCLHMTNETAVLINALIALGAEVRWCSSNRFSTSDSAAAAVADDGVPVYAWHGQTEKEFDWCKEQVVKGLPDWIPNMVLDDGAELTSYISKKHPDMWQMIKGVTEETTSGLFELNKMNQNGELRVPAIVINNSVTKTKFDNIYGCHESLITAIKKSAKMQLSGKVATVIGYGDVGKGCCRALRGNGVRVQVIEIDPISALQASMDGFNVVDMNNACSNSHIFITATGNKHVINELHFEHMKDRAVLCNMGNFNNEIDVDYLNSFPMTDLNNKLKKYKITKGKSVLLIGNGAPANLACGCAHSSFVVSASFSNQIFAQIELWNNLQGYTVGIHSLPRIREEQIALYHLNPLGAVLSYLTEEQAEYIGVNSKGPFKPDYYRY